MYHCTFSYTQNGFVLVENSFYIVNFQNLKCYNCPSRDNIRLSREAVIFNKFILIKK